MGNSDSKYNRDTEPEFFDPAFGGGAFADTESRRVGNKPFGTYDPMYGFPNGRKVRETKTTWEMMERAHIPYKYRDYCVDYYMQYQECRKKKWPLFVLCKNEKHEYSDCVLEDHVVRLKEYEREKRLLQRAKRKRLMQQKSDQELLE